MVYCVIVLLLEYSLKSDDTYKIKVNIINQEEANKIKQYYFLDISKEKSEFVIKDEREHLEELLILFNKFAVLFNGSIEIQDKDNKFLIKIRSEYDKDFNQSNL
jgi:hypothetical protein